MLAYEIDNLVRHGDTLGQPARQLMAEGGKPALPDAVLRAIYGQQTPEEKTAALDASLLKCVARL